MVLEIVKGKEDNLINKIWLEKMAEGHVNVVIDEKTVVNFYPNGDCWATIKGERKIIDNWKES